MYLIRETFTARPGRAGELARLIKEEMRGSPDFSTARVMLDFVTNYNQIVIEYEIASLADFEKMMVNYKKEQAKTKTDKPPAYTELYQTGKREIFKIV